MLAVHHGVFSPEACARFQPRPREYHRALVNDGFGVMVLDEELRKCERAFVDDTELAAFVFERCRPFLPQHLHGRTLVGVNERLRVLRYAPGDYFKPHTDGAYCDGTARSQLTLQIYLNEGFQGGETRFVEGEVPPTVVVPRAGSVLIFDHFLEHEGCELRSGTKLCVRCDVMYTRFHQSP